MATTRATEQLLEVEAAKRDERWEARIRERIAVLERRARRVDCGTQLGRDRYDALVRELNQLWSPLLSEAAR